MDMQGGLFIRANRRVQHVVRGAFSRDLVMQLAADFDTTSSTSRPWDNEDAFEDPTTAREMPEWAAASFVERHAPASGARRTLVHVAHRFSSELDRLRSMIGSDATERLYERCRSDDPQIEPTITLAEAAASLVGSEGGERSLMSLAVYMALQQDADRFIADPRNFRTSKLFTLRSTAELDDLVAVREWIATDAPPIRAFAALRARSSSSRRTARHRAKTQKQCIDSSDADRDEGQIETLVDWHAVLSSTSCTS